MAGMPPPHPSTMMPPHQSGAPGGNSGYHPGMPPPQYAPNNINNNAMFMNYPLKDVPHPHPHDVLCGRGGATNNHIGNSHWRQLVQANKELYLKLPKRQKQLLSKSIVHAVRSQNPPGRFLQKHPQTDLWYDVGDNRALEKTSQALREGAPKLKEKLKSETETKKEDSSSTAAGKGASSGDDSKSGHASSPASSKNEKEVVALDESNNETAKPKTITPDPDITVAPKRAASSSKPTTLQAQTTADSMAAGSVASAASATTVPQHNLGYAGGNGMYGGGFAHPMVPPAIPPQGPVPERTLKQHKNMEALQQQMGQQMHYSNNNGHMHHPQSAYGMHQQQAYYEQQQMQANNNYQQMNVPYGHQQVPYDVPQQQQQQQQYQNPQYQNYPQNTIPQQQQQHHKSHPPQHHSNVSDEYVEPPAGFDDLRNFSLGTVSVPEPVDGGLTENAGFSFGTVMSVESIGPPTALTGQEFSMGSLMLTEQEQSELAASIKAIHQQEESDDRRKQTPHPKVPTGVEVGQVVFHGEAQEQDSSMPAPVDLGLEPAGLSAGSMMSFGTISSAAPKLENGGLSFGSVMSFSHHQGGVAPVDGGLEEIGASFGSMTIATNVPPPSTNNVGPQRHGPEDHEPQWSEPAFPPTTTLNQQKSKGNLLECSDTESEDEEDAARLKAQKSANWEKFKATFEHELQGGSVSTPTPPVLGTRPSYGSSKATSRAQNTTAHSRMAGPTPNMLNIPTASFGRDVSQMSAMSASDPQDQYGRQQQPLYVVPTQQQTGPVQGNDYQESMPPPPPAIQKQDSDNWENYEGKLLNESEKSRGGLLD